MRAALRHPLGLALLVASLALAVATRFMPVLEPWSAPAPWLVFWGLLAYAATVIVHRRSPPGQVPPEVRKLQAIRQSMEAWLAKLVAAEGRDGRSERTRILAEAIAKLDQQVEPALRETLEKQQGLANYLAKIEEGSLPAPSEKVLARLKALYARKQAAIEECIQQAANAAGTLMAMLQEGDDETVAARARLWAKDLLDLYDAIAAVWRSGWDEEETDRATEPSSARAPVVDGMVDLPPSDPQGDGPPLNGFANLVRDALRRLNDPAALSECELIKHLPKTLAATRARSGDAEPSDATPLRQSQALRDAIGRAIEGLKPAKGDLRPGSPEALQYYILHEEYVRGMSTASIMVRYSISESTFHRNRRQAIVAVARELRHQEELLDGELARR